MHELYRVRYCHATLQIRHIYGTQLSLLFHCLREITQGKESSGLPYQVGNPVEV